MEAVRERANDMNLRISGQSFGLMRDEARLMFILGARASLPALSA
jgi:hypothetical protein